MSKSKSKSRQVNNGGNLISNLKVEWKVRFVTPFALKYKYLATITADLNINPIFLDCFSSPVELRHANWAQLSSNGILTMKMLLKYAKYVDWGAVSGNPGITVHDVKSHPTLGWDWFYFSSNPNLTIEFVKQKPGVWSWYNISANPGITMNDVRNNPKLPWDWRQMSFNPNIDIAMINKLRIFGKLDMMGLSENAGFLTVDRLRDRQYSGYVQWDSFMRNPNIRITIDIALEYNLIKGIFGVSGNAGITMQDIMNHPEFLYPNLKELSSNPNLTIAMINLHANREWNWSAISANPGLTMKDIENNPQYPWVWNQVFRNNFALDEQLYTYNQLGRVLMLSMFDSYTNGCSNNNGENIDNGSVMFMKLLVFHNDYHLIHLLSYI